MSFIKIGDDLLIDTAQQTIYKDGVALKMPDLSYRLLLTLAEQAPQAVNREELIKAVWQERIVSDESLKQRVTRLRGAIGDKSAEPSYILAVRGVGYRLVAPIERLEQLPELNTVSTEAKSKINKKRYLLGGLFILLLTAISSTLIITYNKEALEPLSPLSTARFNAADFAKQARSYYIRYHPKDNEIAANLYHKAMAADPNYSPAYSGLANVYAQGYLQFGTDYSFTEEAVSLAQKAIVLSKNSSNAYKALGLALLAQGNFSEAITANNKSAELDPTWAAPVNNNAEIHQIMGNLFAAYRANIEAIEIDVKDPIPYIHLGNTFRELLMPEHALKSYQDSLLLKPDYLMARNDVAKLYNRQDQYDKSLEIITKTLEIDPTNRRAIYSAAISHMMLGQTQQAIVFFERASVSMGAKYPLHARVRLAILQNDVVLLEELTLAVKKAISRGEKWPSYSYLLSLIYASQEDEQLALISFQQAVSLGFIDYQWAQKDPMLASLQQNPEFIQLLKQISERVSRLREQVIKLENVAH